MRAVFWVPVAYCIVSRVAELFLSRRNEARATAAGGFHVEPDGTRLLLSVHVLWFVGLFVEELAVGPRQWPAGVLLTFGALAIAAEVTRIACLAVLGERWTVGVVVWPGRPLVRTGPYRFFDHPNYLTAAAVLAALPIALGLPWVAAAIVPLKLWAVRRRVAIEERALGATSVRR